MGSKKIRAELKLSVQTNYVCLGNSWSIILVDKMVCDTAIPFKENIDEVEPTNA
jgi:hypothetical protein